MDSATRMACRAGASVGGRGDFAILRRRVAHTTADSVVWMLLARSRLRANVGSLGGSVHGQVLE